LDELLFSVVSIHRLIWANDNYQWFARCAILTSLNQTVKEINLKLLKELEGHEHWLFALDKADVNN
jgi:hypothetical protein